MDKYKKIGCIADLSSQVAKEAFDELMSKYSFINACSLEPSSASCDVIIALGGDGFMLKIIHAYMNTSIPIYGMNRGSVGFLMNQYQPDDLLKRLQCAKVYEVYPLEMKVETVNDTIETGLAINEVSLLRETNQAAQIEIYIDDKKMMEKLVCDGVLVSTPAGSTAYNLAANGPIIPLGASVLAITPISPFRPRRWRGALLSHQNQIKLNIINPEKRPVSAVADFNEVRDVKTVFIKERQDIKISLLFDIENNIEDRIIKEQFML